MSGSGIEEWVPERPEHIPDSDFYSSYRGKVVYDSDKNLFTTNFGYFTPRQCAYAICGYSDETGMSIGNIQLDHLVPDYSPFKSTPKSEGILHYSQTYIKSKDTVSPPIDKHVRLLRNFMPVPPAKIIPPTTPLLSLVAEHAAIMRRIPFHRGRYSIFTLTTSGHEYRYELKRNTEPTSLSPLIKDDGSLNTYTKKPVTLKWRGAGGGLVGGSYSLGSYSFTSYEDVSSPPIFVLYLGNKLLDVFEISMDQLLTITDDSMIAPFAELRAEGPHVPSFRLGIQTITRQPRGCSSFNEIVSIIVDF